MERFWANKKYSNKNISDRKGKKESVSKKLLNLHNKTTRYTY